MTSSLTITRMILKPASAVRSLGSVQLRVQMLARLKCLQNDKMIFPSGTGKCRVFKSNHECSGSETLLGKFGTRQECEAACHAQKGCQFFIYGKGSRATKCYWEYGSGCRSGFVSTNNYDLYKCAAKSTSSCKLWKAGHYCKGAETRLHDGYRGRFMVATAAGLSPRLQCEAACKRTNGCVHYSFSATQGKCFWSKGCSGILHAWPHAALIPAATPCPLAGGRKPLNLTPLPPCQSLHSSSQHCGMRHTSGSMCQ